MNLFSTGNIHFQLGIMYFQLEIIPCPFSKMLRRQGAIVFLMVKDVFPKVVARCPNEKYDTSSCPAAGNRKPATSNWFFQPIFAILKNKGL